MDWARKWGQTMPGTGRTEPQLRHCDRWGLFCRPRALLPLSACQRLPPPPNDAAAIFPSPRTCASIVRPSVVITLRWRSRNRSAAAILTSCVGTCCMTARPYLSMTKVGTCWSTPPVNICNPTIDAASTRRAPRSVAITRRTSASSRTTGATKNTLKRLNKSTNTPMPCSGRSLPIQHRILEIRCADRGQWACPWRDHDQTLCRRSACYSLPTPNSSLS